MPIKQPLKGQRLRDKLGYISDPAIWKLLMSPVRMEIAEAIRSIGPCSTREIADFLDRPADSLYRHLALLESAELVREAGFRRHGRHNERLVDLTADDFRPAFDPSADEDASDAIVFTAESVMKSTRRLLREVGAQQAFRISEEDRNVAVNWEFAWLRQEDFNEAVELFRRLKTLMEDGKKRREGRPFVMLTIASEVVHERRAATQRTNGQSKTTNARPSTTKRSGKRKGAGVGTGPKSTSSERPNPAD